MQQRMWEIRTKHADGTTDFNVFGWRWQRQAYGFAIDWYHEDPSLMAISVVDEAGYATPLTLTRPR